MTQYKFFFTCTSFENTKSKLGNWFFMTKLLFLLVEDEGFSKFLCHCAATENDVEDAL